MVSVSMDSRMPFKSSSLGVGIIREELTPLSSRTQGNQRVGLIVTTRVAMGKPDKDAAKELELGEEMVLTHMKKAQVKLGARNRTHAVVEAIRHHTIV